MGPTHIPRFFVKQKITMMVNRYEILAATPDGKPGQMLAFAEQKRFAFKEQVTFFADASKTQPVFGFKARQVMDLNAGYDVRDADGVQIGFFRKDFGASLIRSTFHVEGPGYVGTGQERSMPVALLRRFVDLPLPIHFDYADASGQPLLSVTRGFSIRDNYEVSVPDARIDFRVAAAVAVAMDALMAR
ncbi:hypothetical protein [Nocardioides yefusunii]|uniref:Uncharacterized protein n=1 Tax=Nocardioides yefusunii TaxID=2500546 RepID=A0ABW1QXH4_9ACTN|nr:hypothetical protein [Nocardioides yefusunii]